MRDDNSVSLVTVPHVDSPLTVPAYLPFLSCGSLHCNGKSLMFNMLSLVFMTVGIEISNIILLCVVNKQTD